MIHIIIFRILSDIYKKINSIAVIYLSQNCWNNLIKPWWHDDPHPAFSPIIKKYSLDRESNVNVKAHSFLRKIIIKPTLLIIKQKLQKKIILTVNEWNSMKHVTLWFYVE